MTLAFKEWSYIVDALGKGKQSIILRKGGIDEENGEFNLKGKKFILFPTLFHQAKELIKEDWLPQLEGEKFQLAPNKIRLDFFAEVVATRVISDWVILQKLYEQHAWKQEIISERFNRWEKNVHLLILQVYKLEQPVDIELLPKYDGCKSWVELEEEIELTGKAIINEKIKGTFW